MKKTVVCIILITLTTVLVATILSANTYASALPDVSNMSDSWENEDGSTAKWTLKDGVFTLSGGGHLTTGFLDIGYGLWGYANAHDIELDSEEFEQFKQNFRNSITKIVIEDGEWFTGINIFDGLENLVEVSISEKALYDAVNTNVFSRCKKLPYISFPEGLRYLGMFAFSECTSLRYISLPVSTESISKDSFAGCTNFTDIYYAGTEEQWNKIDFFDGYGYAGAEESYAPLLNATVHYNSTGPDSVNPDAVLPVTTSTEYIYDTTDPGEETMLDYKRLDTVVDRESAIGAVQDQLAAMTAEQKDSPTGIDLATLYAETAVSRAARKEVTGSDIVIDRAALSDIQMIAVQTSEALESVLAQGGISTARYIANAVTLSTSETGEITIKIDPDVLDTEVDKIQVETPDYALTFKVSDLREDLQEGSITVTAESVGTGFGVGSKVSQTTVKLNMPRGKIANPATVSLPTTSSNTTYQTVVRDNGATVTSKYNPATNTIGGKVTESGQYTVKTVEKDFSDISNKSAEMQNAIRYLASRGVIGGTGDSKFSPDASISRAEIAALLVRSTGKLNNSLTANFADVTKSDWYYAAAASSQKCGLVKGYEDRTFRGKNTIQKDQIVAMSARVLTQEMGYKTPGSPALYLNRYSDSVTQWAQPEVALATKENLVVYRTDGTFSGAKTITRGDAAIILYRLFQKIW